MPTPTIISPNQSIAHEQARNKMRITSRTRNLYHLMLNEYNGMMDDVWNNSKLTPQESLDSLDNGQAIELAQLGAALKEFILTINPEETKFVPQPNQLYVDGTRLMVGDPIIPEPEV